MFPVLPLVLTAALAPAQTPDAKAAPAADFSLKDIHRRARSLADYKDAKAFVVDGCYDATSHVFAGVMGSYRTYTVRAEIPRLAAISFAERPSARSCSTSR